MVVRGGMKLGLVAARGGAPTDKDLAIARYGDLVGKLDLRPASCRSWISGFFFLRRRRLQESAEPEAAAVAVSLLCPMCLQVNRALNNVVRLGSPAHGGREARALAGGSAVVSTVSATGLLAPARSGSIRVGSCAQRSQRRASCSARSLETTRQPIALSLCWNDGLAHAHEPACMGSPTRPLGLYSAAWFTTSGTNRFSPQSF